MIVLLGIFLFQSEGFGNLRILLYKEPSFSGDWCQEEVQENYSTIKVTNPNLETLFDFQVKLELDPASFDYTNCEDGSIGIWTGDGSTQVPYWIEKWNPGGESLIWFKAPELAANGDTQFRLHCGGEKAGQSNGEETFEFFDDFEGSLDTSKWEVMDGSWTTVGGNLKIPLGACYYMDQSDYRMWTRVSFGGQKAFRFGIKLDSGDEGQLYPIPHARDHGADHYEYHRIHFRSDARNIQLASDYGSGDGAWVSWYSSDSVFQMFDLLYDGSKFKLFQDGKQKFHVTDIETHSGPFLWFAQCTKQPWWVNFFAVRKCRIPEPTATVE